MRSPTLALLWLTWGRHRWGLAALFVGIAGLCSWYGSQPAATLIDPTTMAVLSITLTLAFIYIIYVFSYADLGARVRTSGFPVWMFTLPVPTRRLVFWPMLFGPLSIALAWMAVAHFVLQPAKMEVPLVWPALALAVSLAWVQALDWSPLGGVTKALAAGGVLAGVWLTFGNESLGVSPVLLAAGLLPLAFVVGVAGVGHARRGGQVAVLAWTAPLTRAVARLPRRRRPFSSPNGALLWWEMRRNGIVLPVLIGCWLAFLTCFAPSWERGTSFQLIIGHLGYLPFLGILVGCALGKSDVWSRPLRLSAFMGTRPVRTGDLVVAKLRMAALSLLATWLVILACGVLWMTLTGGFYEVEQFWHNWLTSLAWRDLRPAMQAGTLDPDTYREAMQNLKATPQAYGLLALCGLALFGFTWLLLVGNLFASLSGRLWVLGAVVFFYLGAVPNFLVFQGSLQQSYPEQYRAVVDALPTLLTVAVAIKFAAAGSALYWGYRRGLLTVGAAVEIVLCWCVVLATVLPVAHLVVTEERIAWRYVVLACVLACPLVRIAGAPLILEWNRRR